MENAKSMLTEVSPKDSRGLLTQNGRSLRRVPVLGAFGSVESFADEVALPTPAPTKGAVSLGPKVVDCIKGCGWKISRGNRITTRPTRTPKTQESTTRRIHVTLN